MTMANQRFHESLVAVSGGDRRQTLMRQTLAHMLLKFHGMNLRPGLSLPLC